jgi:hypothetical protein
MVTGLEKREYACVADFAAGDGALLRAARRVCRCYAFVATDASSRSVHSLRRREPAWQVGLCDFLSASSRARCHALKELRQKASLILLNPPFSCRGGSFRAVELGDSIVKCSLALAFVLSALDFLAPDGLLVALLPAGCLHSDKDRQAWQIMHSVGRVDVLGKNASNAFDGCFAKTALVRFRRAHRRVATPRTGDASSAPGIFNELIPVEVIRGRLQVPRLSEVSAPYGLPFIHSTDLHSEALEVRTRRAKTTAGCVSGPAVLVHRVGQPSRTKIALYLSKSPIVLSDCVIALKVRTQAQAAALRESLWDAWDRWAVNYTGTCAPYITVKRVSAFLAAFGYSPNIFAHETARQSGQSSCHKRLPSTPRRTALIPRRAKLGEAFVPHADEKPISTVSTFFKKNSFVPDEKNATARGGETG